MFLGKRQRERIEKSFGKNPLEDSAYYDATNRISHVRKLYDSMGENSKPYRINEVTWNDLEMDRVFFRMNHTQSFIGEQVLYAKLHLLSQEARMQGARTQEVRMQEERQWEEHLAFWKDNGKARTDVSQKLFAIGKAESAYYLADFLKNSDQWRIGNSFCYHLLQGLMAVCLIAGIVFDSWFAIGGLILLGLINLTIYIYTKNKYDSCFDSLLEFKRVYDFAKWMEQKGPKEIEVPEQVKRSLHSLRRMSYIILGLSGKRQAVLSGDVMSIAMEYLWGILLIDVSMFNHMMKILEKKQEDVSVILNFAGQIDAEISIASYRESISIWCIPELTGDEIHADGLCHPLISNAVPNQFVLTGKAVITGTNASGKSTFLKSLAINCILAQTIGTCTATEFRTPALYVSTCMALRDDVLTGESYYMREAKCLKQILDDAGQSGRMFIIIDEILKGTNTGERIAASKAILEYLTKSECLVLVATHDTELTQSSLYENYYFSSTMRGECLWFDYKIHKGINAETNAIDLLAYLKYPQEIVKRARQNLQ